MKLIIKRNQISESPEQFIRRAGYGFIRDHRTGQESYVRRLGSNFYPRLHMYIEGNGENASFNLHLDQKQASYEGAHMHNAEYDGEVVENEMARLKQYISNGQSQNRGAAGGDGNEKELLDSLGGDRDYTKIKSREEKKSWWKKIFSS